MSAVSCEWSAIERLEWLVFKMAEQVIVGSSSMDGLESSSTSPLKVTET